MYAELFKVDFEKLKTDRVFKESHRKEMTAFYDAKVKEDQSYFQ